jgi:hypothetical protein
VFYDNNVIYYKYVEFEAAAAKPKISFLSNFPLRFSTFYRENQKPSRDFSHTGLGEEPHKNAKETARASSHLSDSEISERARFELAVPFLVHDLSRIAS